MSLNNKYVYQLKLFMIQGEKLKQVILRLRNSIAIAFDKNGYEIDLASLRDRNADLHLLRSQIADFQRQRDTAKACSTHKPLPTHFLSIRRTSHKLHEAFSEAWCCPDLTHSAHSAKLCLEAHVQDTSTVRLDLALTYDNNKTETAQISSREPAATPIWIYVQSINVELKGQNQSSGTPQCKSDFGRELSDALSADSRDKQATIIEACNLVMDPCRRKQRKVHLSDDYTAIRQETQESQETAKSSREAPESMFEIKNLCQHVLQASLRPSPSPRLNQCIGYLETPNSFKHIIYSTARQTDGSNEESQCSQKVINIAQLLQGTKQNSGQLDPALRLKLAQVVATSVLRYHSTPWMKEWWRLYDISYYGSTWKKPSDESLQTLHFTSIFENRRAKKQPCKDDEGNLTHFSLPDAQVAYAMHGVNNLVLFSLGIALLEIGHHRPLEFMISGSDNPISAARKLAESDHPLGQRYQRMVQQCLQCNFGMGTDLSKGELQSAVYGNVVCQLEEMVRSLSLD